MDCGGLNDLRALFHLVSTSCWLATAANGVMSCVVSGPPVHSVPEKQPVSSLQAVEWHRQDSARAYAAALPVELALPACSSLCARDVHCMQSTVPGQPPVLCVHTVQQHVHERDPMHRRPCIICPRAPLVCTKKFRP